MLPSERRTSSRAVASCPGVIEADGRELLGFVRDMSDTGALVFMTHSLPVGRNIVLRVVTDSSGEPREVRARVVRVQERDRAYSHPWRFSAALRFLGNRPDVIKSIPRSEEWDTVGPA